MAVGSGNLTRGGYGDNTELFFVRDLRYEVPDDAAFLGEVLAFVEQCAALARQPSRQLGLLLNEVRRRIATTPPATQRSVLFVDSFTQPVLDQLLALVPDKVRVNRAGVLAPFFETDDAQAQDLDELSSVLGRLTAVRRADDFGVDVGVVWEGSLPDHGAGGQLASLSDGIGRLLALATRDEEGRPSMRYLTLRSVSSRQVEFQDAHGEVRRMKLSEAESARSSGALRTVPSIVACAPAQTMELLAQDANLSVWLHPAWRFEEGKPGNRPLHAKLVVLDVSQRDKHWSLVLVGSPNPSRRAMLRRVADGGNVECAVVFRADESLRLVDLCPELVWVDRSLLRFRERDYPAGEANLALWVERAVHDPAARSLVVTWCDTGPAPLGTWTLRYGSRVLASGDGVPVAPLTVLDFDLRGDVCELTFEARGGRFAVPIVVSDLAQLPASPELASLGLRELLALLGQRIGGERLGVLRASRGPEGMTRVLDALFVEGFAPTDVFRACWLVSEQLAEPGLSVVGFQLRLAGATGLRALWKAMLAAVGSLEGADRADRVSRDEAWFYGSELLRTLGTLSLPEEPTRADKQALVTTLQQEIRDDLAPLAPDAARGEWVRRLVSFYDKPSMPVVTTEVP